MQSNSWKFVLVTGLLVVAMATTAQAYPSLATGTGNSCSACHTNEQDPDLGELPGMEVTSPMELNLDPVRNDGNPRGPLKHFIVEAGNSVTLTMNVLPADPGERD